MAANDPRPVVHKPPSSTGAPSPAAPAASTAAVAGVTVPRKPAISIEDAELFASRIRPSWELVDDSMRGDLAAELGLAGAKSEAASAPSATPDAAKAGAVPEAPASGPDTIIDGVPMVDIGDLGDVGAAVPAPAALAGSSSKPAVTLADPDAARPAERIQGVPAIAVGAAPGAPAAKAPAAAPPKTAPAVAAKSAAPAVPARAGKTKVGMGEAPKPPLRAGHDGGEAPKPPLRAGHDGGEAPKPPLRAAPKTLSDEAPAAKGAPSSRRAVKTGSPAAVPAAAASRAGDVSDEIEIPGTSNGLGIKLGIGAAAVVALGVIGFMVLGGSGKKVTPPAATATVTAAAPVPLPATVPPPPLEPEPVATAKPTASVSASTSASAAPSAKATAEPKDAAEPKPAPEPKKAAAEPKPAPEAKKAVDKPVAPKGGNTTPPAKKGGGIIRDSPF